MTSLTTQTSETKTSIVDVEQLFLNPDQVFHRIPDYQRNFSWGQEEIHQLVDDLIDAMDSDADQYFLGNLVTAVTEVPAMLDVIDGQQRLTTLYLLLNAVRNERSTKEDEEEKDPTARPLEYQSRRSATDTLSRLQDKPDPKDNAWDSEDPRHDSAILNGYALLYQYLHSDGRLQQFASDQGWRFLTKKAVLVQIILPEGTDLNRYFEVMNTRGAQLSQEDIIKAQLMSSLGPRHAQTFGHIWDACADMDHYVQMNLTRDKPQLRTEIFGDSWDRLFVEDFEGLHARLYQQETSTDSRPHQVGVQGRSLTQAIQAASNKPSTTPGDEDDPGRFRSTIGFGSFLLQVLSVITSANPDTDMLDDKRLIERFEQYLRQGEDTHGDWARSFAVKLLKIRVLFDQFVLKRDLSSPDTEDGEWSLQKFTKSDKLSKGTFSPQYRATFGASANGSDGTLNKRIRLLQSALRITYTSPRTMGWITELLDYLYQADSYESIEGQRVLRLLENYARRRTHEHMSEGMLVGQGFAIGRIVYTYLDYLILVKKGRLDFRFPFRTSVEHFAPQVVDQAYSPPKEQEELATDVLHSFGNLALVTVSDNSKFSNSDPTVKRGYKNIVEQSPKLENMAELTREKDAWGETEIMQHYDDVMTILLRDLEGTKDTTPGTGHANA